MSLHRVLIDIEFTIDEDRYKIAQLVHDATGISDVTDEGVREAIIRLLLRADWAEHGLTPLRSIITSRRLTADGYYQESIVPAESSINST